MAAAVARARVMACLALESAESRSGLRQTTRTGFQLRVLPDQRSLCRWRSPGWPASGHPANPWDARSPLRHCRRLPEAVTPPPWRNGSRRPPKGRCEWSRRRTIPSPPADHRESGVADGEQQFGDLVGVRARWRRTVAVLTMGTSIGPWPRSAVCCWADKPDCEVAASSRRPESLSARSCRPRPAA